MHLPCYLILMCFANLCMEYDAVESIFVSKYFSQAILEKIKFLIKVC